MSDTSGVPQPGGMHHWIKQAVVTWNLSLVFSVSADTLNEHVNLEVTLLLQPALPLHQGVMSARTNDQHHDCCI